MRLILQLGGVRCAPAAIRDEVLKELDKKPKMEKSSVNLSLDEIEQKLGLRKSLSKSDEVGLCSVIHNAIANNDVVQIARLKKALNTDMRGLLKRAVKDARPDLGIQL
jgi:hypothetical protein